MISTWGVKWGENPPFKETTQIVPKTNQFCLFKSLVMSIGLADSPGPKGFNTISFTHSQPPFGMLYFCCFTFSKHLHFRGYDPYIYIYLSLKPMMFHGFWAPKVANPTPSNGYNVISGHIPGKKNAFENPYFCGGRYVRAFRCRFPAHFLGFPMKA